MKKFFIILSLLLLFFSPIMVSSYFFAEPIIAEVAPQSIIEGNFIKGVLRINASCDWQDPKDFSATVNYGGSEGSETLGSCPCATDPASTGIKTVICDFDFNHQYNTIGQYSITPSTGWFAGGGFGGVPGSRSGAPVVVNVLEGPPVFPGNGAGNPLATSTIAGLVTTITNIVYVIAYMLTALFIMVGGFMIITSSGKPEQITKGRQIVLYTIIAFAVLVAARGIINFILILIDAPTRI
ncbi:pilin [Patescibacteria group bacterium]|nr:pilin [Patescibacteria group bacterium]MBU4023331.1 pilin [Patescibacteria group bacterium]MBU4078332.1 pilin [Patescibacteria group bacterium]